MSAAERLALAEKRRERLARIREWMAPEPFARLAQCVRARNGESA